MKKVTALFIAMVTIFALCATSLAVSRVVSAELHYNNIKITLDGQELTPVDGGGNPVEPFIIDGTTYLPVRGIASALGLDVQWDQATSTVILTHPQNETDAAPTGSGNENTGNHHPSSTNTVYVSNRSNTIHSVHDCGGMKNYREMTRAEAESNGYKYCPNCW